MQGLNYTEIEKKKNFEKKLQLHFQSVIFFVELSVDVRGPN